MTDPLAVVVEALVAQTPIPFDWIVEHAPDGNLDAALARLWYACKDPWPLESIALLCYDRVTLAEGRAALVVDLARRLAAAPGASRGTTALIRRVARETPVNWQNGESRRTIQRRADAAVAALEEKVAPTHRAGLGSLAREAVILASQDTSHHGTIVPRAITTYAMLSHSFYLQHGEDEARIDIAKVLRRAWRPPTAAEVTRG